MPAFLPSAYSSTPLTNRLARTVKVRAIIVLLLLGLLFLFPNPAVAQTLPGASGNALTFDGVDDYVEIPYGEGLGFGSGDFTVEFWVQRLNDNARADLFSLNNLDGKALTIYIDIDKRIHFDTWENSLSSNLVSNDTVGTGWTHIALVRKAKVMSIYINGRLSGSSSLTLRNFESNSSIRIGKIFRDNNHWLRGAMDELRVWRTARTQSEILQNMYRTLAVPQANLIAYYTFDQSGTDAVLTDSSGNGHHGQLMPNFTFNPSPWRLSGAFQGPGNALLFDGSNDFVSIQPSPVLQPGEYTIEGWINRNASSATERTILSKGNSSPYHISINPGTGKVSFSLDSTTRKTVTGQTNINTSQWYHLAATYSPAGGGTMKLYINGVLEGSLTGAGTPVTNTNPLTIGHSTALAADYYTGLIDEVRIWSRARTVDEIRETMARALTGSEAGLVAYYRFDQAKVENVDDPGALRLFDWGPYGLHGSIVNFPYSSSIWPASSAFNTWIGGVSEEWIAAGNWSRNAAPSGTDTVGVPAGSAFSPTISANAAVGNLVISSGGALIATGSPTLTIGGHWFNQGAFTPGNSTVALSGSNQSLGGSTTFNHFTKTVGTSADTLYFPAGETQTVTGTLRLQGTGTRRLALRSSQTGVQWKIDPRSARELDYLDVQDSYNVNPMAIAARDADILNSGNNTGWSFGSPPVITEGETVDVTMSEDGDPVPFSLTLHATDPDGDDLTWSLATPPLHGTAESAGSGEQIEVGYIPNTGYSGEDSFDVTVSDNRDGSDSITVNVTVQAADTPPVLAIPPGALSYTEGDDPLAVAPSLSLTGPDGLDLTGVRVSIENYHPGEDFLVYTTTNGVSGSFDVATGVLTLTGSHPVSDYEAALRAVRYRNASEKPSTEPRTIVFTIATSSLYSPVTGHFYEYVPASGITWTEARARAEDRSKYGQAGYPSGMYGLQGYLATITSAEENAFLTEKVSGTAWIGASDGPNPEDEGVWRWVTGPEAGTQFWQGDGSGSPVGDMYTNWDTGEPNNMDDEDYAHMMDWTTPPGRWNDLPNPGSNDQNASTGYMVEYGGMEGDPVLSLSGQVTVNVTAVNDAPVFTGISALSLAEDGSHNLNLEPLFTDPEEDPISFAVKTGPAHGSTSIADKILTYTPTKDYHGSDSVTVTASDGKGGTLDVMFTYTISPVNDAPVFSGTQPVQVVIAEDSTYSDDLSHSVSDVDGDTLTCSVTDPAHGDAAMTGSTLTYTPDADYNGSDTFQVTVDDGKGGELVITFNITITPVNDPPVFSGDLPTEITLSEDGSYISDDLRPHFSDVDDDVTALFIKTEPANGSARLVTTAEPRITVLTYTPNPDFNGSDSLTLTAHDGKGGTLDVTFTFTITPVNDPPVLSVSQPITVTIDEDETYAEDLNDLVSDVDGDSLIYSVTEPAVDGDAVINGSSLTYTPDENYNGVDGFQVTVDDGHGESLVITFKIIINAVNDPPVFSGDLPTAIVLNEDESFTSANLLPHFSDVEDDSISFAITTAPANGSASLSTEVIAGGLVLVYTPTPDFNGSDSLTLTATDGQGGSLPVVFNFTVASVNDAPTSASNTVTTDEDTPYVFAPADFPYTDVDDGDSLQSVQITTLPDAGSLTLNGDPVSVNAVVPVADLNAGRLVFQPAANANGFGYASFTFRVSDRAVFSGAYTLTIDVTPVNDAPVISGTPADTVAAESPYSFIPSAFDVDDDPLTFSIANKPAWASFDPATGALTGTPVNADAGVTTGIVITVSDGQGGSASLPPFNLTVTFTNHPPVAIGVISSQTAVVGEGFAFTVPLSFFTDPDAQDLVFTAGLQDGGALPGWLTFDAASRTFSGTPGLADAGTLFLTVTATDPYSASAALNFSLTVESPDNRPPLLAQPIPDQTAAVGTAFTFPIPAAAFFDPDGDPLTYHAQLANGQRLPDWLALDADTFRGTPPETGVWAVLLTASDGQGGAVSTTFNLTVTAEDLPPYLQVLIPDVSVMAGEPFTFTLEPNTFVDPNGDLFILQAELADGSPLPDWLHFDPHTLTFSGTPPAGQSGVLLVQVFVLEQQLLTAAPAALLAQADPASDEFLIAISAPDAAYLPADITGVQATVNQTQVTLPSGQLPVHPHLALKIETRIAGPPAPAGWVSLERDLRVSVVDANGSPAAVGGTTSICFALTEVEWAQGNGEARNFAVASATSAAGPWRWLETVTDAARRTACAEVPFGLVGLFVPVQPEPDPAAYLPATGFAPGRVTPLPTQSPEQTYDELGSLWLEILRLGVQAEIVGVPYSRGSVWDVTWLGDRAGWLESTAFPTWSGNSLLAAHAVDVAGRPGPFARLGELRYGDWIIVHLAGQRYVYEVRTVDPFTAPDDTRALRHEEMPWLTLVTCRGYDEQSGEYRWRTVVRAVLVRIEQ